MHGVAAVAASEAVNGTGPVWCEWDDRRFDAVLQLVEEGLLLRQKQRFRVLPPGRWPALELQLFSLGSMNEAAGGGGGEFAVDDDYGFDDGLDDYGGAVGGYDPAASRSDRDDAA